MICIKKNPNAINFRFVIDNLGLIYNHSHIQFLCSIFYIYLRHFNYHTVQLCFNNHRTHDIDYASFYLSFYIVQIRKKQRKH